MFVGKKRENQRQKAKKRKNKERKRKHLRKKRKKKKEEKHTKKKKEEKHRKTEKRRRRKKRAILKVADSASYKRAKTPQDHGTVCVFVCVAPKRMCFSQRPLTVMGYRPICITVTGGIFLGMQFE